MKIVYLIPLFLAFCVATPIFGEEEDIISRSGGLTDNLNNTPSKTLHQTNNDLKQDPHKTLHNMMNKKNYVDALKNEIEKSHKNFMKVYNEELKKLRDLTKTKDMKEFDYSKARSVVESKYKDFQKAIDDIRKQNSTLSRLKDDDDYEEEKHLVSHFNEYVKVYKSLLIKNRYIKHNCICNNTVI
jgi:plasmid replication initiation protein